MLQNCISQEGKFWISKLWWLNFPNFPHDQKAIIYIDCEQHRILSAIQQIYTMQEVRGSLNKFPDFDHRGTFIDSTHMKL